MRFWPLPAAAILAAFCTAACGISTPSSNTVEPISGTVAVGGTDVHSFNLSKTGEVEVTITSLSPPPSASIAMALGQVVSGGCAKIPYYDSSVVVKRVVQFGSLQKGGYCLILYDTGVLKVPTAYAGTISRP